jgi:hypothetical protein
MKKSVIALAVAAAMPVAAQADIKLSGSVSAEYTLGSNLVPSTEAELTADSSQILANGMTATASFSVLGARYQDTDAQGTVSLSGDFGELKGGNKAKTLEDVADGEDGVNEYDASLNGIAYTGDFAGLSVNASAGKFDEDADDDVYHDVSNTFSERTIVEYSTYGASYNFNGLTLSGKSTTEGTASAVRKMTASYSFGDLTVSGTKETSSKAVVKAAYEVTKGDLAVKASADSSDDWDLEATYNIGELAVTAKDDELNGGAKISAKYTAGDLSLEVDSDSKVTVAYDIGNADLSMVREKNKGTKVKYTVAF